VDAEPFTIRVSDAVLDDLRERLARTRWPDQPENAGWDYGTNLEYLRELVGAWLRDFDWRKEERALNALPQFRSVIDGLKIHFVHVRGKGPRPLPLIITHGWPSSFAEIAGIVGPLSDPAAHGGDPADAFDVVVPSLPGFGFSDIPERRGPIRVDRLWRALMADVLGYPRFFAHGTDVGARVTSALGRNHADAVAAIHLGSVDLDGPDLSPDDAGLSAAERDYLRRVEHWETTRGAYIELQATTPQTAAYGLNDSPAGLAAWIVEKYRAWSDCDGNVESRFSKEVLLTNITIYWVTGTINASMRRYYEARHDPLRASRSSRVDVPTGIAMFPGEKELVVPRAWAERGYNVVHWTDMPRGGHFPALEEPQLLVDDLRAFFRQFR
jgi:pimeloyl-ACP methyl ester carboxylesterase